MLSTTHTLFSLHSDFLILPGFIDFVADEVVSTPVLPPYGTFLKWSRLTLHLKACVEEMILGNVNVKLAKLQTKDLEGDLLGNSGGPP